MKFHLVILMCLMIVIMPFIGTIKIPWSAVDDWYTIKISKEVSSIANREGYVSGLKYLIQQDKYRVRYSYWLSEYTLFQIFGHSSALQHAARVVLLALATLLVIKFSLLLFSDERTAIVAGLLFGLFGATSDNWIRLGPAEVFQVLFLLGSFNLIFFRRDKTKISPMVLFSGIILMIFGILSKETSVTWLIFPLLIYVFNLDKQKYLGIYLFTFLLATTLIAYLFLRIKFLTPNETYISNFSLDYSSVSHFIAYQKMFFRGFGVLYPILLLLFPRLLVKDSWKSRETRIVVALIAWFVVQLLLQSFWGVPIGRYLLPIIVPFCILLGYSFSIALSRIKFIIPKLIIISLLTLALAQNVLDTIVTKNSLANRDLGNWRSLEYLSKTIPPNHSLYANIDRDPSQIEWWYGLNFLLQSELKRNDLIFLPMEKTIPKDSYVFHWSGSEFIPKSELEINNPFTSIIYSFHSYGLNNGKSIVGGVFELISKLSVPKYIFGAPYNLNWYIYKT